MFHDSNTSQYCAILLLVSAIIIGLFHTDSIGNKIKTVSIERLLLIRMALNLGLALERIGKSTVRSETMQLRESRLQTTHVFLCTDAQKNATRFVYCIMILRWKPTGEPSHRSYYLWDGAINCCIISWRFTSFLDKIFSRTQCHSGERYDDIYMS
jgi:hypothetical protein